MTAETDDDSHRAADLDRRGQDSRPGGEANRPGTTLSRPALAGIFFLIFTIAQSIMYVAGMELYVLVLLAELIVVAIMVPLILTTATHPVGLTGHPVKPYLIGVGVGTLMIVVTAARMLPTTALNRETAVWLALLLIGGIVIQSFAEELLLRGLIMSSLVDRFGAWPGIIGSSVIFGALHLLNEGVTVLSTLNTVLVGIVFGLMFVVHNGLWAPAGAHCAWNAIMGPILGVEVSGFELPASIFTTASPHPYGFEATGVCTVVIGIAIAVYAAVLIRRRTRTTALGANLSGE
ncbi:MAG: CPBP family intramembrane glutamic endopeptidase [Corynebacterium sp.]|nr:CPBP family intramembrane glutamic endopeptidase [Corynebacterium sp.]